MGLSWASLVVLCISAGLSHGRSPRPFGDFAPGAANKVMKEEVPNTLKMDLQLDSIKNIVDGTSEEVTNWAYTMAKKRLIGANRT